MIRRTSHTSVLPLPVSGMRKCIRITPAPLPVELCSTVRPHFSSLSVEAWGSYHAGYLLHLSWVRISPGVSDQSGTGDPRETSGRGVPARQERVILAEEGLVEGLQDVVDYGAISVDPKSMSEGRAWEKRERPLMILCWWAIRTW